MIPEIGLQTKCSLVSHSTLVTLLVIEESMLVDLSSSMRIQFLSEIMANRDDKRTWHMNAANGEEMRVRPHKDIRTALMIDYVRIFFCAFTRTISPTIASVAVSETNKFYLRSPVLHVMFFSVKSFRPNVCVSIVTYFPSILNERRRQPKWSARNFTIVHLFTVCEWVADVTIKIKRKCKTNRWDPETHRFAEHTHN